MWAKRFCTNTTKCSSEGVEIIFAQACTAGASLMPCCNGNRPLSGGPAGVNPSRNRGIAGFVSHYGEDESGAATSPAGSAGSFPKMVGAGVTIWAITRVLDKVLGGSRRK